MKKLFYFLSFALLLVSCNKNNNIDEELKPVTNDKNKGISKTEPAIDLLHTGAIGLINVIKNKDYLNQIKKEALKQFDEDDNVLFKKVEEIIPNFKNLVTSSIVDNKPKITINSSLSNFENFEVNGNQLFSNQLFTGILSDVNAKLYPQIYIAFSELHTNSNEFPVIAVQYAETSDCIAVAYKLLADGNIIQINVDEEYAKIHPVWVVSYNESVDENGKLLESPTEVIQENHNSGNRGMLPTDKKQLKFRRIVILDRKECWTCGKADISWVGIQLDNNCSFNGGTPVESGTSKCFAKVSRFQIGDILTIPDSKLESFLAGTQMDELGMNEFVTFAVYERDIQRSGNKKCFVPLDCSSNINNGTGLEFYSSEQMYGKSDDSEGGNPSFLTVAVNNNLLWQNYTVFVTDPDTRFNYVFDGAKWDLKGVNMN